jgi:plastocyanin
MAYLWVPTFVLAAQAPPAATITGWVGVNSVHGTERPASVVWVDNIPGDIPAPKTHAILNQTNMRFVPRILTILVGTTVDFPNSDPFVHNVFSISPAKRFNLGLYSKERVPSVTFDKPGVVSVFCNVHLEMSAYIIVLKNVFFAIPGSDGAFIIRNVPPGRRTVRYWTEDSESWAVDGRIQERVVTLDSGSAQTVDFRTAHGR